MNSSRVIGKITRLDTNKIEAELLSGAESHVINAFDDIYKHSVLESFVGIRSGEDLIIGEVVGLREKDFNNNMVTVGEYHTSKSEVLRYIDIAPLGTLLGYPSTKFEFGVSKFPQIYSDVVFIEKPELDIIFNVKSMEEKSEDNSDKTILNFLPIGRSHNFPEYEIKININSFFGSHSAVLGNTGSGKSCTISAMIQRLFKKKEFAPLGTSFVLFDVNGEYSQAFDYLNKDIHEDCTKTFTFDSEDKTAKQFLLPHWFLNVDEWAMLLRASEKTQLPVLRTALGMAVFLENNKDKKGEISNHIVASCILGALSSSSSSVATFNVIQSLLKNHGSGDLSEQLISTYKYNSQYGSFPDGQQDKFMEKVKSFVNDDIDMPAYKNLQFDFDKLGDYLNLAILYEESFGNKQIRDYCSQMLTRYKVLKDREEFGFLKAKQKTAPKSVDEFICDILGLVNSNGNLVKKSQISIIDMNIVDDEIVEIVSSVVARLIFEKLRKTKSRNKFPVNLILEEAHRYISTGGGDYDEVSKIFERIAKEGRKYGLFILLSSQRPSELSKTVLSQCSSFIVHRILNPEDLQHIKRITPSVSETILNRLPSLPTRHALVFGASTNLPAVFKVNKAEPKPKSDNNSVSENWFVDKEKVVLL